MKFTDVTDFVGVTATKTKKALEPEQAVIDRAEMGPKEVLLSWTVIPNLASKKLDPRYRRTLLVVGIVVAFLLILMKEIWLIFVVISFIFISQAVSKTDPAEFTYEISTYGIQINDDFYYWDELKLFFFTKQYAEETLAVDVQSGLPSRLFVAFRPEDRDVLIELLNKHLQYIAEEPQNFVDKAYNKMLGKFDFEKKA